MTSEPEGGREHADPQPEPDDRAVPRRLGLGRALLPAPTLLGVGVSLLLVVERGYVAGGLALALTCWLAALLRLLLPTRWVGSLAVRRTWLDVVLLVGLGTAVAVLTTSVPTP